MTDITRFSPLKIKAETLKTESRDNWNVVLEYAGEGSGPWLVDLSHKTRWDLQDSFIDDLKSGPWSVPSGPGSCTLDNRILVNRMNRTQAAIWHLGIQALSLPDETGFTEVTESTAFMALFGPNAFHVVEKMTALDVLDPSKTPPFLLQGPCCHVPCQVVVLEKQGDMSGGILFTCSRGYADSMVAAVLDAGQEFNLKPAGENRFTNWLQALSDE